MCFEIEIKFYFSVHQDGQTPLLVASRKKNANIVYELLNYGCKLSVTDRNGDNALHIALRNRNRDITELLLSNPKYSKYLYKPNKCGETPYKVDASNPKSIITQIFGASKLLKIKFLFPLKSKFYTFLKSI